MEGSWLDSYRNSSISLIVFFAVGFVPLAMLNVRRARAIALVGKGPACYGDKLPAVRASAEVKLENSRGASLHHLHSRGLLHFTAPRRATGPGNELADAIVQIYFAPGVSGA
jgi:hypothetical protein